MYDEESKDLGGGVMQLMLILGRSSGEKEHSKVDLSWTSFFIFSKF
jgi:hypothetical protein